jgi:hypothetical protein
MSARYCPDESLKGRSRGSPNALGRAHLLGDLLRACRDAARRPPFHLPGKKLLDQAFDDFVQGVDDLKDLFAAGLPRLGKIHTKTKSMAYLEGWVVDVTQDDTANLSTAGGWRSPSAGIWQRDVEDVRFSAGATEVQLVRGSDRCHGRQQEAMLVYPVEIVEHPDQRILGRLSHNDEWLSLFDLRHAVLRQPLQLPGDPLERLSILAHRKFCGARRCTSVHQNALPNQVVKARPQMLENFPDQQRDLGASSRLTEDFENVGSLGLADRTLNTQPGERSRDLAREMRPEDLNPAQLGADAFEEGS